MSSKLKVWHGAGDAVTAAPDIGNAQNRRKSGDRDSQAGFLKAGVELARDAIPQRVVGGHESRDLHSAQRKAASLRSSQRFPRIALETAAEVLIGDETTYQQLDVSLQA
jgi:hypothetical protein